MDQRSSHPIERCPKDIFYNHSPMSEYSHLCFPPEQMTCKSKYDVRVDQDRTQVYDTGAGLPVSGRAR